MGEKANLHVLIDALEQVMVQQFRGLQRLVELTRGERQNILQNLPEKILKDVEDKEAQIDQLSLLEDHYRMLIQNISLSLGQAARAGDLQDILLRLPQAEAERINRLSEGILTLIRQAHDLNLGNAALVQTRLQWVQNCQLLLIDSLQPVESYSHPGTSTTVASPVSGRDYRV